MRVIMSHSWGWEVLPQGTKLGRGTRDSSDGAWGYEGLQDSVVMVLSPGLSLVRAAYGISLALCRGGDVRRVVGVLLGAQLVAPLVSCPVLLLHR